MCHVKGVVPLLIPSSAALLFWFGLVTLINVASISSCKLPAQEIDRNLTARLVLEHLASYSFLQELVRPKIKLKGE